MKIQESRNQSKRLQLFWNFFVLLNTQQPNLLIYNTRIQRNYNDCFGIDHEAFSMFVSKNDRNHCKIWTWQPKLQCSFPKHPRTYFVLPAYTHISFQKREEGQRQIGRRKKTTLSISPVIESRRVSYYNPSMQNCITTQQVINSQKALHHTQVSNGIRSEYH